MSSCAVPGIKAQQTSDIAEGRPLSSIDAPSPSLDVQKVESLVSIPETAEIIASAPWAGQKNADGFSTNELYVMDSNGEHITRITHNGKLYNHIAVSPNRKMIAAVRFTGDTNGNGIIDEFDKKTLWILDLANKKEWPLFTDLDAGWGGVDWSPDSLYVYFSVLKGYISDIYRICYDGTGLKNITAGIHLSLPWPSEAQSRPKWVSDVGVSPDGQWIAFHYQKIGAGKGVVAVCRVDGTEARTITDGGPMKPGKYGFYTAGDFDPEFSPDGTRIVFARTTDAATNYQGVTSHDIMTVKIDGTELNRLSPAGNTGANGIPDWSEDNRIIFSDWNKQDRYAGPGIVNADGSNYHRLNKAWGATWVRWIPRVKP